MKAGSLPDSENTQCAEPPVDQGPIEGKRALMRPKDWLRTHSKQQPQTQLNILVTQK
jgi:hypothetical protein